MEYIKNQTAQTRGFLLMMALVIGIFKISGSVIAENWSWVGILSIIVISFTISEIYFFQHKKKGEQTHVNAQQVRPIKIYSVIVIIYRLFKSCFCD